MPYLIDPDLLTEYLVTVRMMSNIPSDHNAIRHYIALDTRRTVLHDQILKSASVEREDSTFQNWFANFIELSLMRRAA